MENQNDKGKQAPVALRSAVSSLLLDEMGLLHERALKGGQLTKKVKELIALATAVSTQCETSIAYHLHNALEAGAAPGEVIEAIEVAVFTMSEPAAVHGDQVLKALASDEGGEAPSGISMRKRVRQKAGRHPYMSPD